MYRHYLLKILFLIFLTTNLSQTYAQPPSPLGKVGMGLISLNGKWQYIIDPYETGFYDYRYAERSEKDKDAYWNSDVPSSPSDKIEHGYSDKNTLRVPSDWNSQDEKLLYYEGTIWYKKSFDFDKKIENQRVFIHFGAVNYRADVYLNGKKLGKHIGGFTPFEFEVTPTLLRQKNNWLVVKVDNKRHKDEIPTLNTDWWNYGGITRDVTLRIVPNVFIQHYSVQLSKNAYQNELKSIEGWVKTNAAIHENITLEIPFFNLKKEIQANGDSTFFKINVPNLKLWSPKNPTLYKVIISTQTDKIEDKIGFRNIEVQGEKVLLNGKRVFFKGISIHEEIPKEKRRANSRKDALYLLGQAKQLNANMVRLAHYPHNENMTKMADSLGLLVWSEIPVYWTVNFGNPEVLAKAQTQLKEMIERDRNRASIVIWSVGNETPPSEKRLLFMSALAKKAKQLDSTRIIAAALENFGLNGEQVVKDELAAYTDIIAVNQYIGWYGGLPNTCRNVKWAAHEKPFFFSETGAEAVGKMYGDSTARWTEDFQEWYYKEQVAMWKRMPSNFLGVSPWILNDFRSPRRNNPVTQNGWNNKGLFDQKGRKKKAFYVVKKYYDSLNDE